MNIKEIQQLIKFVAKSGVSEVKIESKDLKLSVKTGKTPTIVQSDPQVVYSAPVHNEPVVELQNEENNEAISSKEDEGLITIKSPIIGTFYRKPSPDSGEGFL
jgi:acetyl-CoA carboxylase biotin carboxyl carrier protein